ncbi:hypothetical protein ACFE04_008102 [Oxalis oulophora]
MAARLTPIDNEYDVTTLMKHWKEDGIVEVFVEMVKKRSGSENIEEDDGSEGDQDKLAGFGNTDVRSYMLENSENDEVGTDKDDISVDGISFCSEREDDELDYELEPNYLEDPTLNWSYTTDEDYDQMGDDEVQLGGLDRRDDEEVPHTGELFVN